MNANREKNCSTCKLSKSFAEYSPDKRARDGLQSRCKPCARELRKKSYHDNIESSRAWHKENYRKNKERIKASSARSRERRKEKIAKTKKEYYERVKNEDWYREKVKKYQEKNKDKKREYDKAYRAERLDIDRERSARWRAENPELRKAVSQSYKARRRTQEDGGISSKDLKEWKLKQKKVCYWCGCGCAKGYHVDHYVPLSKGGKHEADNLVISCADCNLRKNAKDPYEFAQEVGRLL